MKKGLLIILLFSIITNVFSQSSVGNIRLRPEYYQTNLKKKDFKKLKESKTFFVLPSLFGDDSYSKEDFKQIFDKVWTVTPIEIIEEKDIDKNVKIGNSFIRLKSRSISIEGGSLGGIKKFYVFNYFKLGVVNKIKKKKKGGFTWWEDFDGVVFFTTNVDARVDMIQMMDTIHGDLLDYRLGYIKNYFQQLNDGIKESKSHNVYDDYVDEKNIKVLKKKKLYVPQNILYGYNAITGNEKEKSAEELFEDYSSDYEVIDENELSDKILNDTEPFYYLMYHQKNSDKIITVVESTTGKIIYRRHTGLSWNIKPKDLKALIKRINKS